MYLRTFQQLLSMYLQGFIYGFRWDRLQTGRDLPYMLFPARVRGGMGMRRAALERTRTFRTWRRHLAQHLREIIQGGGQRELSCHCEFQVGRFRKGQRVGGCGQSGCLVCEKVMGILRIRDRRQQAREHDAVLEMAG